ncbi:MAG TPA: hypothetical protein VGW77_37855 [Candidatus Binatia bacterium]|jgi:hypothetical protein|nr:hypothetical protein [Candidatus Binatia bacterium]
MTLPGASTDLDVRRVARAARFMSYVVLNVGNSNFLELNKKILVRAEEFDYKKQSAQKIAIIN